MCCVALLLYQQPPASTVLLEKGKITELFTKISVFRFWNQEVHFRVHNSPPLLPNLNQKNPSHATFCFLNIPFNTFLPSAPRSPKCPLSKSSFHPFPSITRHMPHPSPSSGLITQIVSLFCHSYVLSATIRIAFRRDDLLYVSAACSVGRAEGRTELKAKCLKLTDMLDILVESSAVAELQDQ